MYICQYVQGIKIIKVFLKLNTSWSTILFTINYVVFALEIFKTCFSYSNDISWAHMFPLSKCQTNDYNSFQYSIACMPSMSV